MLIDIAAAMVVMTQNTTPCTARDPFAIAIHGGTARAGVAPEARLIFMEKLLNRARGDLRRGARALDVAENVVAQMEDSGLFNAGRAAIANKAGFVETDASIMDGRDLRAGAVASQLALKNPVKAARLVMDTTPHAMLVGDRGETTVVALGAQTVPADYFLNNKQAPAEAATEPHGTVGAAVLDRCGDLAAATSTGGYDAKLPGRVGDSPVIGAGVYAQNGVMAGSATGHGEYFIRYTALRSVAARMEFGGATLAAAGAAVIEKMATAAGATGGRGGIVTVDAAGNVAMPFSSEGMVRGYTTDRDAPKVGAFAELR